MEEAAQLERALHEANLASADPRHEEAFQKIGAIRRITGEMSLLARQLVQAFRELEQANERIAAGAEPQPTGSAPRSAPRVAKSVTPKVVKSRPEK